MINKYLVFLACTLIVGVCNAQKSIPIRIGLIREGISLKEFTAVKNYLETQKEVVPVFMSAADITDVYLRSHHITHIWWVKDSVPITADEQKSGAGLLQFVEGGGHLLLSMEAVRLLNEWGIEKNKLDIREDSVIDEGFGRPQGFHSYQKHPIFDGLHGGAYIWKGKTDHVARKIGFFGQHLPDTGMAKVIGIGWSYITFHEDEKLVIEYSLGKGSIIAVGAYTYFSRPNFNTEELYRFYTNIFKYTAGRLSSVKSGYWSYARSQVLPSHLVLKPVRVAAGTNWKLSSLTMKLERNMATDNFVDVAGRRMLLMGKERGGIDEIWTHPFMSFRDIQTAVQLKGKDTLLWLKQLVPQIIVSPEMIIRKYVIGHDTLREMITVDFDKPVGVLHYEWTGNDVAKIWIKYTSNLRAMWPYSDTSSPVMSYQWSEAINAALVSNQHAGSLSIMGFSDRPAGQLLGQFKDFRIVKGSIRGIPASLKEVSGLFGFDANKLKGKFNAYMIAGDESIDKMIGLYRRVMPKLNTLYQASSDYYSRLLKKQMMITSPDKKFNEGYRWAMVRSDQFLQTTPKVGTSMMAGFGTTAVGWNGRQAISGRPGYAWYFGRDGEWSSMALDAMGGFEKVRQVLDLLVKYQAVNGKIFHELTSSGAVHYDASDATPLFVVLASHYLHYSGDSSYIRRIWASIKKAMDFCYSTDTDQDGLIENTNVGHGWVEGGPLFGTHTEFYLAGSWAAALDAAGYMAAHLRLPMLQKQYERDAKEVKKIIDQNFWSAHQKSFYHGKMLDGSYMKDATVLQAVPILLNTVIDPKKAWQATDTFAANNFSTDWGMRIIPDDNPNFNPGAYHAGMVWPLFSGYASLAEYKTGHYISGFTHMMNNLLEYQSWALGSVGETMNGANYRPAGVCSQQGWSETMVIQPAIEGMLGFNPDALSSHVEISPCFPWDWNKVNITQMHVGKITINMNFQQSKGKCIYQFQKVSGTSLSLNFNPVLAPGTRVRKIWANGKEISFSESQQGQGVKIMLPQLVLKDHLQIILQYTGGIGVLPLVNEPLPQAANIGIKIVQQQWQKDTYKLVVEGVPGKTYQLKLYSGGPLKKVENASVKYQSLGRYLISGAIPKGKNKYGRQDIIIWF